MNRKTIRAGLLALCALALCLGCAAALLPGRGGAARVIDEDPEAPIYRRVAFQIESDRFNPAQTVSTVGGDDGVRYVYLPSYAEMDGVRLSLLTSVPLTLGGVPLRDGMTCGAFPTGEALELAGEGLEPATLVFLASANVATLYVDTESGSMSAVNADKTHKEKASLALYAADGSLEYRSRFTDQIRGRGQSSWKRKKKPYNLYLDRAADLMGMGKSKRWCIIANMFDECSLRNWLAYTLADRVAPYAGFAPECRFVDVYLNGRYNGLYLLCEKVQIQPGRLEISTESWLFDFEQKVRWDSLTNPFDFGEGIVVEVVHPVGCTEEERKVLEDRLAEFQTALLSEDGVNPDTGKRWSDYIDLDSFARKYLIEEMLQNYDAGSCSQYFFWNAEDDLIYAGPCWDYDLTLGVHPNQTVPNCFLARRVWKTPTIYTPWYDGLWQHEEFRDRVIELYRTEFQPAIRDMMASDLPQKARELEAAVAANSNRWRSYYESSHFLGSLDHLRDYLEAHISFLDSAWLEGVDYKTITFRLTDDLQFHFYCLPAGSTCEDIPSPADFLLEGDYGWFLPDGTPFNPGTRLTEDLLLEARAVSPAP